MKSILMISLCSILLFLSACGAGGNEAIPNDEKGRELFSAFHERFYRDSAFQMQRIEFPMLGSNPAGDNGERFFWDEDNWTTLKTVDPEDQDIEFVPFYDMGDLMRERIIVQDRFMIENLFSLINNKWYMTSFSGIKDIGTIVNPNQEKEETPIELPVDSF